MYRSKASRIAGYIFKSICMILIFGTIGILLWRVFSSGDPQSMKSVAVNDELCAAYEEHGEDRLTMYRCDLEETTSVINKNYGYFSVTRGLFIEEADQVQVTFRYNNSTIKHLKEDYGLETLPSRDEDLYDVTLYVAYDITPQDLTDNDGNDPESVKFVRYYPDECISDSKNLYNYRKFIFNGVDMTVSDTPVLAVYVDVYYKEDVNYDEEPYGTLIIYDYATKKEEFKLSGKDIEAIKVYAPKENDGE